VVERSAPWRDFLGIHSLERQTAVAHDQDDTDARELTKRILTDAGAPIDPPSLISRVGSLRRASMKAQSR
jgi:hypothetical protein